jgi:hypothetical protein
VGAGAREQSHPKEARHVDATYRFFFRSRFRLPFFPCNDLSSVAFARLLFLTFAFV